MVKYFTEDLSKRKKINLSFCCLKNVCLPAEVTITQDTRFVQLALDIRRYWLNLQKLKCQYKNLIIRIHAMAEIQKGKLR